MTNIYAECLFDLANASTGLTISNRAALCDAGIEIRSLERERNYYHAVLKQIEKCDNAAICNILAAKAIQIGEQERSK